MLTGEVPAGHFEPPSKKVEVDVRLDEVILRALEREPERRYQHASDVKSDVDSISHTAPPAQTARTLGGSPSSDPQIEAARQQVRVPATWLIVIGSLWSAVVAIGVLPLLAWLLPRAANQPPHGAFHVLNVTLAIVALVVLPLAMIVGALKMLRLTSYRWAVGAAVLALSPFPFIPPTWLVTFPLGIWSLVVLSTPAVKRGFALQKYRGSQEQPLLAEAESDKKDDVKK